MIEKIVFIMVIVGGALVVAINVYSCMEMDTAKAQLDTMRAELDAWQEELE